MPRGRHFPGQMSSSGPHDGVHGNQWLQDSLGHVKELSDRVTELSTLMGVSSLVSSQLPLTDVLEQVCRLTAEICRADVAFVHLSDGDDDLVCLARHAPDDSLQYAWEGIAKIYGRKAVGSGKMSSRSSLLLPSQSEDQRDGARMGGICSVPLRGRARVVGSLAVGYAGVHRFSAREKDMLSAVSAQLALAVERSWLFDQLQDQLDRAKSLREVTNRIGSNLRLDLVLDSIVNHASKLLAAEFSAIFLVDSPTGPGGEGSREETQFAIQLDDGPLGTSVKRAVETGAVAISRAASSTGGEESSAEPKAEEYSVALSVPLLSGEQVLGSLALCYLEGRRFDDSDIALAEDFASQAALAIGNARVYEEAMQNRLSLESAINQINNHGISLMDGDLNVRFANPATFWLLGVKPRKGAIPAEEWEAMVGKSLAEEAELGQIVDQIRQHPEETVQLQLRARGNAVSSRSVKLVSFPLREADGTIRGRVNLLEEE